jgi:hypothetical protein
MNLWGKTLKGDSMIRHRLGYYYNMLSVTGILLAIFGAGLMIIFLVMELITGYASAYTGLMVYFAFPAMLIIGLLLIPIGMLRERKRRGMLEDEELHPPFPTIDFNEPHQRRKFIFFVLATLGFVFIISIATIEGYNFTESVPFCGTICHTVMKPEYTTWGNSPHAKVRCAECHIGSGAQWFVKTKLSGLRQVYKVLTNSYPTPIETPVANLRPARETCEECHWPEKFYSGRQKNFYYYATDENNTPREVDLLLKIGGTPLTPNARGIHWHIKSKVYFQPRDWTRQEIPYIRVQDDNGKVTEFVDTEKPLAKNEIAKDKQRLMDCIDCHDRPTHIFRSPSMAMDDNFVSGHIDSTLPYIKKVSVEILGKPYKSNKEAFEAIASGIKNYYAANYPALALAKADAINNAVKAVQGIYSKNFFPEMNTTWSTHPDNIGHFYWPGCFRCHDGKHKSADGKVISKDCNLCHQVIAQKQGNISSGAKVKTFVHPEDIGDELVNTNCNECHAPGNM